MSRLRALSILLILTACLVAGESVVAQTKKDPPPKLGDESTKIANKTFDQWIKEISSKDPSRREAAIRAVVAFPPETAVKAIPYLLAELRRHTPSVPVDLSVRCALCNSLGDLFSLGERVDTKLQVEAVALLRNQFRETQSILRYRAAVALGAIGQEARVAIPELTQMLKDPTCWEMRQAGATALGSVANDANGPSINVLKSLYELLHDPAYQVRLAAVQTLSILGPPGEKALADNYVNSLLPVALKDPEPGLQIWARVAIIGATSDFTSSSIAPIVKYCTNPDPGIRTTAIQALGTLGSKVKSTVPTLIASLNDPEVSVQVAAMWALTRMESAAANALPVLEKIAADPNANEFLKKSAKDTIEKIKGK